MREEMDSRKKELTGKKKISAGKQIKIMILAWICWKLWSIPWKKARQRRR